MVKIELAEIDKKFTRKDTSKRTIYKWLTENSEARSIKTITTINYETGIEEYTLRRHLPFFHALGFINIHSTKPDGTPRKPIIIEVFPQETWNVSFVETIESAIRYEERNNNTYTTELIEVDYGNR